MYDDDVGAATIEQLKEGIKEYNLEIKKKTEGKIKIEVR